MEASSAAEFILGESEVLSATSGSSRYRWVILFATWIAFVVTYTDRTAWSSVAVVAGRDLSLPIELLGAFVTACYVGYVVSASGMGLLTDTIGARRTLTYALLPCGVSTFAFGYAHSFGSGIALQFLMGLTSAADYAAGMKMITSWFKKDRGLAMGIFGTATSMAVLVGNATVPSISKTYGWPNAFRLLGLVTVMWGLVCFAILRDSPFKGKVSPITKSDVRGILTNKSLAIIALAGFAGFWATVGFTAWANALMTKEYGFSLVKAGAILAVFGIGALFAKPLLGWVRDLLGFRSGKILPVVCLLLFAVLLIVFAKCSTERSFYWIAPFLGAAAFGYTPLLYVLLAEASNAKSAGAAAGFVNTVWQLGSAISPLAVGVVYGHTHSFTLALDVLAAGPLFSVVALCFLRRKQNSESKIF
jgi:sugar phosphate permease